MTNSAMQPQGMSAGSLIILVAVGILMLASVWKIFTKASKPGWASIIPIYNIVVLLEIVRKPMWWTAMFFIPFVNLIFCILLYVELAKAFGRSGTFAAGLIFLSPIFFPILGFGSAQHIASDGRAAEARGPVGLQAKTASGNAVKVRKLFEEFDARPNLQAIERLNALITDSDDPEVTTAILNVFEMRTGNMGVFGLALQSLGLVRDPRALPYLMGRFDDLEKNAQSNPNPQLRSILTDHYRRAGVSIVNLVSNSRDLNPQAIPYLKKVYEFLQAEGGSEFAQAQVKAHALFALERLAGDNTETRDYVRRELTRET